MSICQASLTERLRPLGERPLKRITRPGSHGRALDPVESSPSASTAPSACRCRRRKEARWLIGDNSQSLRLQQTRKTGMVDVVATGGPCISLEGYKVAGVGPRMVSTDMSDPPLIARNPAPFPACAAGHHTTVVDGMVSWCPPHTGGRHREPETDTAARARGPGRRYAMGRGARAGHGGGTR